MKLIFIKNYEIHILLKLIWDVLIDLLETLDSSRILESSSDTSAAANDENSSEWGLL